MDNDKPQPVTHVDTPRTMSARMMETTPPALYLGDCHILKGTERGVKVDAFLSGGSIIINVGTFGDGSRQFRVNVIDLVTDLIATLAEDTRP